MAPPAREEPPVSLRTVFRSWWPLAASWLLMGLELPVVSAIMARLADPEIHLAAYGGVVFPVSLIVEAPIIMLLAASTALSRDDASYRLMRRFMVWSAGLLTLLHALLAFTPLYDLVVGGLIDPPAEVLGPARIGLMIMTPWTAAIAYRRFQQGVMIRFGHSQVVGIGTLVRLVTNASVLVVGLVVGTLPGIVVGSTAVAVGVTAEAFFIGFAVRPILRDRLRTSPPAASPLTWRAFASFYTPLALTSFLTLAAMPMVSAALSRMPRALDSLAAWPVISGLTFVLRAVGFAYNEVVVALLDRPRARRSLWSFSLLLGGVTSALLVVMAATPLANLYFGRLSALSPILTDLSTRAIWLVIPLPALAAMQSWYQGVIVHSGRTRAIPEAVAIYLLTAVALLIPGTLQERIVGLYIGLAAYSVGGAVQMIWLWHRSREYRGTLS